MWLLLNAKIQENLTPEFLATVTEENKLDLTSFITNPNIFNNTGVKNQMPGGWILGRNDAVQLGILREVIHERQDRGAIEQQALALAGVGHIGKLVRGNAQLLGEESAGPRQPG